MENRRRDFAPEIDEDVKDCCLQFLIGVTLNGHEF